MSKVCKECGCVIENDNARFCSECGAKFEEPVVYEEVTASFDEDDDSYEEANNGPLTTPKKEIAEPTSIYDEDLDEDFSSDGLPLTADNKIQNLVTNDSYFDDVLPEINNERVNFNKEVFLKIGVALVGMFIIIVMTIRTLA